MFSEQYLAWRVWLRNCSRRSATAFRSRAGVTRGATAVFRSLRLNRHHFNELGMNVVCSLHTSRTATAYGSCAFTRLHHLAQLALDSVSGACCLMIRPAGMQCRQAHLDLLRAFSIWHLRASPFPRHSASSLNACEPLFVCSKLGAPGAPRLQKAQAHLDLPQAFRVRLLARLVFQYLRVDTQRLLVLLRDAGRASGSLSIAKGQIEHAEELQ